MSPLLAFILGLAALWVVQAVMVYRQGKAFMKRINQLRREGRVSIGVGYSRIRLRTFIVVVANRDNRVIRVERLSGLTIFARPRPIDRYAGLPLTEVVAVAEAQHAPVQILTALRQAADALLAESAKQEDAAGGSSTGSGPAPALREGEGGLPIADAI